MEPAKDRGLSMPNTEITTMNLTTLWCLEFDIYKRNIKILSSVHIVSFNHLIIKL